MPAGSPPNENTTPKTPNQPGMASPIQTQSPTTFNTQTSSPIGQPQPQTSTSEVIETTSDDGEGKKSKKKVIATILGILLLVGGVATGVFLVNQQQEIRIGAWDCRNYVFDVNPNGEVVARNGSTRDEPAQQAKVYINGNLVATLDVPALDAGDAASIGTIDTGGACSFSWEVIGTKDCRNSGGHDKNPSLSLSQLSFTWSGPPQLSHATTTFCDGSSSGNVNYNEPGDSSTITFNKDIQSVEGSGGGCTKTESRVCTQPSPTPGPTSTPTPTPQFTATPTLTPTLPPIGASCHNVKAYDANWNLLTGFDLSDLEAGDIVRFAVAGTTNSGTFDKARFTINGTLRPEVTDKKPGSEEYYDEYTIPSGFANFSVNAQIHHTSLGWF